MSHAPTTRAPRRGRRLGAAVALVLSVLVGFVAVAPVAGAWHPAPSAEVGCVDGEVVLGWTASVVGDPELEPPADYTADVVVYARYWTLEGPLGDLRDEQIASGTFGPGSHSFSGTTTLTPPAEAVEVEVLAEDPAWRDDPDADPSWWGESTILALPDECEPPVEVCEWDPQLPAEDPDCVPPVEVCEWDPELSAGDEDCTPPPLAPAPEVAAEITYACDAPRVVTVAVSSIGGPTTFSVLLGDVEVATLTDVEGETRTELDVSADLATEVTVLAGDETVAARTVDPAECVEVGGVVTQQPPPEAPAPTPVASAAVLPRTGVTSGLLAVVALGLLGVGATLLTAGRRAALVEPVRQRS